MAIESYRSQAYRIIDPLLAGLVKTRVHPNVLTTIGFAFTCFGAFAFHEHWVRLAGFFILLGGVVDIFDGRVATLTGLASKFGAFYDSTLDRIGEIITFIGILSLYNDYRNPGDLDLGIRLLGDVGMIYMVMLAMGGSLMISYTRARAESLGLDCRVGLMPRAERIVLVGGAALIFGGAWGGLVLKVVVVLLAVLTNLTAFQRILWVYRNAAGVPLNK
jgi:CDP-diacylglycerol---glycerol-3-phosphate 3-phosphatidyltransferase